MSNPDESTCYNLQLTHEEHGTLQMVLLLTTKSRKAEAEACKQLSMEQDETGQILYPQMAENAKWWEEANATIEAILKKF